MVKLPFVVQPKRKPIIEQVGSDEAGYITIERRGYLTSGEKSFVQQAITSDDGTLRIINLARKVNSKSVEEGYSDVLAILAGNQSGDERLRQIEMQYFEEFSELLNSLSLMQSKEELITALCLMMYRINPDTTVNDAMNLHPDIISGLAKLYKEEERKSLEAFEAADKAEDGDVQEPEGVEEIEKKPTKRQMKSA